MSTDTAQKESFSTAYEKYLVEPSNIDFYNAINGAAQVCRGMLCQGAVNKGC